jgi:hypothetical protein
LTIVVELIPLPTIFIPRAPAFNLLSENVPGPRSTYNGLLDPKKDPLIALVTVAYASDILDPSPLLLSFPPLYTYFLN